MASESLTEALIADDEAEVRAVVEAAIREVFPELTVAAFDGPIAIIRKMRELKGRIMLVITDGNMPSSGDGEMVVDQALRAEVPHIAYHSTAAGVMTRRFAPLGIACITKPTNLTEDKAELIKWLETLRNPVAPSSSPPASQ